MATGFDYEIILECWDMVHPTPSEMDKMCDAVDSGDTARAVETSDAVWDRVLGKLEN